VKARDPTKHELQKWTNKDGVFHSEAFPHFELGLAAIGVIEKGSPLHEAPSRPGTHLVILDNKSDVTISVTVQGTTQPLEIPPRDSKSAHVLEGSVLTAVSSPPGTFISPASKRILRTEAITYTAGINLEDPSYVNAIRSWLPHKSFSLLYNVPRDDFTAKKFHELCDDQGATLVIVKSQKGNIFGGYNADDWAGNGYYFSSDSFLFSLKNPGNPPPRKLTYKHGTASVTVGEGYHVCFGTAQHTAVDLYLIPEPGGASMNSFCGYNAGPDYQYSFDGEATFKVKEVSVYKVEHVFDY